MILGINEWVFCQAATQAASWRLSHDMKFQISVNMSAVQFHTETSMPNGWFEQFMAMTGTTPKVDMGIVVEITENLLLDASKGVTERLLALRAAGVQLSLDDFGTGYSSLSYLKKFNIDYLKIDQSLVRNLQADSESLAVCEAMIVMAHKLGLNVIAEGVETREQCDLLTAAGCNYGQGYLFSRPVSAEVFGVLLDQQTHSQLIA